ncbi:SpoIID/LytB domain-containing protein [Rhodococcus triatomae]|uniref:SpoIID/LytB domain protein n=1 Tax=Rhodococcus triatomae TaxID=300028 RepID=A0A1G8HY07_9NOCA|nr:SpoIID/LytB domain-containing protein [Rhodococcus triatomae]QNG20907.1 SpoIID/LytB domain-containing protein [Rhodococcus triatomae]QNG23178.1 SpoIID/LytB domain-containing protein [Rhodococcus triatomae]SDI11487.1 SpoIID/LytB domain protein [Rhodococcus triatomae]
MARTPIFRKPSGPVLVRGPRGRTGWRRLAQRGVIVGIAPALVAGVTAVGVVSLRQTGPAVESVVASDTPFTISGRGHGHGRGMGQWGAYGYARDHGWGAERILAHYYGGTTLGALADGQISVRLTAFDDQSLSVHSDVGASVAGKPVGPGEAVHLTPTSDGGAGVVVTRGCGGEVLWQDATDHPWVDPVDLAPDRPVEEHLRTCTGDVAYRGSLGVALDGDAPRVVNVLDMDDYLLGVVPAESRAEWADQGGAEALRAQAVAARSYAAAEDRSEYARTCDTQSCQVYGGSAKEDPRTTEAVRSTAGMVLVQGGKPVATEFSASTGGFSAGGVFPAVEDLGDSISPHHLWTQTVTAGDIARAFGVGELHSVDVLARNNFGVDGGRVTTLKVTGSDGVAEVTGTEARSRLKLKSDWFTVTEGIVPGPDPAPAETETVTPGTEPEREVAEQVSESLIDRRYRELGGRGGALGSPIGPELMLPDESGKFRLYTGGTIIWTERLGVQVVDASILREWLPGTASSR